MAQTITESGQSGNPEGYESCMHFWQTKLTEHIGEEATSQIIELMDSMEEGVGRALFTSAMFGYNVVRNPGNQDFVCQATRFFERYNRDPRLAQIERAFIVAASATDKVLRGQNPPA